MWIKTLQFLNRFKNIPIPVYVAYHLYQCTLPTIYEENTEEVLKLSQLIPNDNAVTSFFLRDHLAQRNDASVAWRQRRLCAGDVEPILWHCGGVGVSLHTQKSERVWGWERGDTDCQVSVPTQFWKLWLSGQCCTSRRTCGIERFVSSDQNYFIRLSWYKRESPYQTAIGKHQESRLFKVRWSWKEPTKQTDFWHSSREDQNFAQKTETERCSKNGLFLLSGSALEDRRSLRQG